MEFWIEIIFTLIFKGLQTFNSADALNIRQPALTVSNNKYGIADIGTWSETHNCSEYRLANALKIKFRYKTGNLLDDNGLVALEMSCTTPSFQNDQSPSNISMKSTANTALSASSGDWGTKLICPDDYFLVGFDLMVGDKDENKLGVASIRLTCRGPGLYENNTVVFPQTSSLDTSWGDWAQTNSSVCAPGSAICAVQFKDSYNEEYCLKTRTFGGNNNNSPCFFPFTYNGVSYNWCTSKDRNKAWCSSTSDYDTDGLWGYCTIETYGGNAGGGLCVIPFEYEQVMRKHCTNADSSVHWCYTSSKGFGGPWGNCYKPGMQCSNKVGISDMKFWCCEYPDVPEEIEPYIFKMNADCSGNTTWLVSSQKIDDCRNACDADENCQAFVFGYVLQESKSCMLKSKCMLTSTKEGYVIYWKKNTYTKMCGKLQETNDYNTDYALTPKVARSVIECVLKCQSTTGCGLINYYTRGGAVSFNCHVVDPVHGDNVSQKPDDGIGWRVYGVNPC